jgi:hypothetical protein
MHEQIVMLERVAVLLAGLTTEVVYTGGATIPLYLNQVNAIEARPTKDVDCVVEVRSRFEYYSLSEKLRGLGLQEWQGSPLCRWVYQDLLIDVMPIASDVLGFTNSWYAPGFSQAFAYKLPSGNSIKLFPVVYLLSAKIEAFRGRGNRDFYASPDLEDIMLLLNGCDDLLGQFQRAETHVKDFICLWLHQEFNNLEEVIPSHLSYAERSIGRDRFIRDRIFAFIN